MSGNFGATMAPPGVAASSPSHQPTLPAHLCDWHLPSGWSWGTGGLWRHAARHVQEVRDPLGRSLALVSTPDHAHDEWLLAEATSLAHWNHPAIPTTYHFWGRSTNVTRGPAYLRRWIAGDTLATRLARGQVASFAEAVRLLRELGQAVAYLHNHRVAHGALVPHNVFLTPTDRLWLLGWEWALPEAHRPTTPPPRTIPTPPEWADGWRPDVASDQWQLGELFVQSLEGGAAAVPDRLADLIARLRAPTPGERYPTMAAMLRELDRRMAVSRPVLDPQPLERTPEAIVRWVTGDDYEVQRQIGSGGRGTVWHVRDLHLGRDVALKVLHPSVARAPQALQQFRQEATLAARLDHPAIVSVLDWEAKAGEVWYTMPLAEHGSLAGRLQDGPLPLPEVLRGMQDVLAGLAVAHQQGILHRDLKPENVLLSRWGGWLIADFGLACLATEAGAAGGTLGFAAPEQLLEEPLTPAVDVYGAAAVAYAALLGRPPVPTSSPRAALAAALHGPPDLTGVPRPLAGVLRRALAGDPQARYPDGGAFCAAWEAATRATLHPRWWERLRTWSPRG